MQMLVKQLAAVNYDLVEEFQALYMPYGVVDQLTFFVLPGWTLLYNTPHQIFCAMQLFSLSRWQIFFSTAVLMR